jgi:hypothetical protein
MKTALIVMFVSLTAFIVIGVPKDKKCSWQSKYNNTLQQDIHREWVCK